MHYISIVPMGDVDMDDLIRQIQRYVNTLALILIHFPVEKKEVYYEP
eukprot:Gb_39583 [translate_table: standard]